MMELMQVVLPAPLRPSRTSSRLRCREKPTPLSAWLSP